jgi:hypothetical protein
MVGALIIRRRKRLANRWVCIRLNFREVNSTESESIIIFGDKSRVHAGAFSCQTLSTFQCED